MECEGEVCGVCECEVRGVKCACQVFSVKCGVWREV